MAYCLEWGNRPMRVYRGGGGGGLPGGGGGGLKFVGGDEFPRLLFAGGGSLVILPDTGTRWPLAYMH